jgi:hypothetical protein
MDDACCTEYKSVQTPDKHGSTSLHPLAPTKFVTDTVFDWDDTLFPTTFMHLVGIRLSSPLSLLKQFQATFTELDLLVEELLTKALEVTPVTIITNAGTGWVQLTARRFLPRTFKVITSRVKIVSARGEHEATYPGDSDACMLAWKLCAFDDHYDALRLQNSAGRPRFNFISIGDSTIERDAFREITVGNDEVFSKSVKLLEQPTTEQLRLQLKMLKVHIHDIVNHNGSIDQMVAIHKNAADHTAIVAMHPIEPRPDDTPRSPFEGTDDEDTDSDATELCTPVC